MATARIQMWGNCRAVRIPKGMADELGLEPGTKMVLTKVGRKLVIEPIKTRRGEKLSDLLARCKGPNPYPELITGRMGRELI
jgi:antitoxin MazE